MEESGPQTIKPNEFVIGDSRAYAMTAIETWKAVEFLLTKLEPINLEDLGSDDRVCSICREEFGVSENFKHSHDPVKTICGHIFGKRCVTDWLDPLRFCLSMNENVEDDVYGRSTCPTCRQVFFASCKVQPLEFLACRLSLWDSAYASAGVARSAKEELSRKRLWEYVEYCRSINEQEPTDELRVHMQRIARIVFQDWTQTLKTQDLTPEQEILRDELERISAIHTL
ncbi:hypothetical protein MMC29_000691 [Sticta canariensis]|nr:hypothetical protein [Sticta canariensis]